MKNFWSVIQIDGRPWVIKGGDLADFKTQIILVPCEKWGIVTLTNANNLWGSALGDLRFAMLPVGIMNILLGQPPPRVSSGPLPAIILAIFVFILLGQLVWMIKAISILKKWKKQPELDTLGAREVMRKVGLPTILYLAAGVLALAGLPGLFHIPLSFFRYAAPDMGCTLLVVAALGIGWGFLWPLSVLMIFRTRKHIPSGKREKPVALESR